jgi:phosphoserine phosphatase RsbU/P
VTTAHEYPHYRPSSNIPSHKAPGLSYAGDLIDVFPSTRNHANIVIASVSGRDAQAQGHASYVRHVIRTLVDLHSPGSLLAWLNVAFHRRLADYGTDCPANVFLASLEGHYLTYASGGHGLALLTHANGRHVRLPLAGTMVGVKPAQRFKERSIAVAPGDRLALVTGATTQARQGQGEHFGGTGSDDPASAILDAARARGCGSLDGASVLSVRFS